MPNIERLQQLRRVVAAAPDDRFEMAQFCSPRAGCGTAYCAAGWAAVDPWFLDRGVFEGIFQVWPGGRPGEYLVKAREGNVFPDLAAAFDIPTRQAENLFGGDLCGDDLGAVSKAEVLANVDRVLAGSPARPYRVLLERVVAEADLDVAAAADLLAADPEGLPERDADDRDFLESQLEWFGATPDDFFEAFAEDLAPDPDH